MKELIREWFKPSQAILNRTDIKAVLRRVDSTIKDIEKSKANAESVIKRQQADVAYFETELASLRKLREALSKV